MFSPQERTKALFFGAMAGSHDNPYTPMGGSVPPEMFFGRDADILNLWRIDGPCIIYGGRQLGKSALLKEVRRRYHDPESMNYVFYEGVQPDSDLWKVFRKRLQGEKLLKSKGALNSQTTRESIKKLLEENAGMRILFLLDECDYMMEQDSKQDFEQIKRLRDLMTETDRRFKAVFTGLHNVQRFQKIPNQPLAHFGSPLRIGPLGAKDAIELIERPLRVLGYKFPDSLAHQILAQTNYHPSLIQLFCHELVTAMLSSVNNKDNHPPFIIKETTVSQVWRRASLSQQMRDRFDWTLNLDKRYRAIGYTVAWLEATTDVVDSGFTMQDILVAVKEIWVEGFVDTSMDEFYGLLDELEGLGVLVKNGRRRYRLRNANVLQLMGGEQGIEDELSCFIDLPPDEGVNPQVMRRIIDKTKGLASPLTWQQEGAILTEWQQVHILVGSEALGLSSVQVAIQKLLENNEESFQPCPQQTASSTPSLLLSHIKDSYRNQNKANYLTFFIELKIYDSPTITEYINSLSDWISKIRSEIIMVRIVVLINLDAYINLVRSADIDSLSDNSYVSIHHMLPWKNAGLEQWFHDIDRPGTNSRGLIHKTGGWHSLLQPLLTKLTFGTLSSCEFDIGDEQLLELVKDSGVLFDPQILHVFTSFSYLEGEEIPEEELVSLMKGDGFTGAEIRSSLRLLLDFGIARCGTKGVYAEPVLLRGFKMHLDKIQSK